MAEGKKTAAASKSPPPLSTSLKKGMQKMLDALVARLDAKALHTSSPVQCVTAENSGWTVSAGYHSDHFDAVILATPAPAAATLLHLTQQELASELAAIRYSSSATITLGYDENV